MKNFLLYPVIISIVFSSFGFSAHSDKYRILQSYGKVPLAFTINNGQYDPQVKFTTRCSGCTMFFTQEGTTFLLRRKAQESIDRRIASRSVVFSGDPNTYQSSEFYRFALKVKLLKTDPNPEFISEDRLQRGKQLLHHKESG